MDRVSLYCSALKAHTDATMAQNIFKYTTEDQGDTGYPVSCTGALLLRLGTALWMGSLMALKMDSWVAGLPISQRGQSWKTLGIPSGLV